MSYFELIGADVTEMILLKAGWDRVSSWKQLQSVCVQWRNVMLSTTALRKLIDVEECHPAYEKYEIIARMPKVHAQYVLRRARLCCLKLKLSDDALTEKFVTRSRCGHGIEARFEDISRHHPITDQLLRLHYPRLNFDVMYERMSTQQIIQYAGKFEWPQIIGSNRVVKPAVIDYLFPKCGRRTGVKSLKWHDMISEFSYVDEKMLIERVQKIEASFVLEYAFDQRRAARMRLLIDRVDWDEVSRLLSSRCELSRSMRSWVIEFMDEINWDVLLRVGCSVLERRIHFYDIRQILSHPEWEMTRVRWDLELTLYGDLKSRRHRVLRDKYMSSQAAHTSEIYSESQRFFEMVNRMYRNSVTLFPELREALTI